MRMHKSSSEIATYEGNTGEASVLRPFISVRWGWLTLPALELFLVLSFLLMTMTKSSRHKGMLWNGCSLAPFYHPLTKEGQSAVEALASSRRMDEVGASMAVRWTETDSGMSLVQA